MPLKCKAALKLLTNLKLKNRTEGPAYRQSMHQRAAYEQMYMCLPRKRAGTSQSYPKKIDLIPLPLRLHVLGKTTHSICAQAQSLK